MSSSTALLMSSLERTFPSAARGVERPVGERRTLVSTSPRPTQPRNSFHPYRSHTMPSSNIPITPPAPSTLHPPTEPKLLPVPSFPIATNMSCSTKPRKPQNGRSITTSHLCPHVAAADCIFSWDTPFGARHRAELAEALPAPLVESVMMAIRGGYAPNTKSTYAAGLLRFTQFCDKWDIAEEDRMPAKYPLLCAFIGEHKGQVAGGTIQSWMSGLRSWHIVHHAPWYGDDDWVKLARVSASKEGTSHKLAPRSPISIEHLLALHHVLNLSNSFHAAIWAAALAAFWGCRRLGEIIVTVAAAFDPKYHVLRSAMYVTSHHLSAHLMPFQCCFSCFSRWYLFRKFPNSLDEDHQGTWWHSGPHCPKKPYAMPRCCSKKSSHCQLVHSFFISSLRIHNTIRRAKKPSQTCFPQIRHRCLVLGYACTCPRPQLSDRRCSRVAPCWCSS